MACSCSFFRAAFSVSVLPSASDLCSSFADTGIYKFLKLFPQSIHRFRTPFHVAYLEILVQLGWKFDLDADEAVKIILPAWQALRNNIVVNLRPLRIMLTLPALSAK